MERFAHIMSDGMPFWKRGEWLDTRSSMRGDLGVRARTAGEQLSSRSRVGDPLRELRDIRVPPEGVMALGLPDVPPDAPPIAPVEEKLSWFEVTVVDAWGEPVGGLDLEVSYEGTRKKVRTPGNGKVRVESVSASFGSVKFSDVPAARDVVRPRWTKKQPDSAPEVDNPQVVALSPEMGLVSLTSETPVTIVLVRPLPRVRLIGMHFDTNKSFMRPTAVRGIRAVVTELEKSPTGQLLVIGHTDSVGPDWENLNLSVDRAEAVKAYLKNDVPAWELWYGEGKEQKTRWGDRETSQMLSALPCQQSTAGFQAFSNETRGTSLAVDGIFGPVTRRELIKAYMELGGTTLPDHIVIEVHGCGELFPADDAGDDVDDQENRRVEMYCFDDKIDPPVPGKKAKKAEPEYDQWRKQVTKDVDVTAGAVTQLLLRLHDSKTRPLTNVAYRVFLDGKWSDEALSPDGWASVNIDEGADSFEIEWHKSDDGDFSFHQHVDARTHDTDEKTMARARLLNLGYRIPDETSFEDAVSQFQADFDIPEVGCAPDGRLFPLTRGKLEQIYSGECNGERDRRSRA